MKFGPVPVREAGGKILAHNIARAGGHRAFRKGRLISASDVAALQGAGCETVYVAELEPGDTDENNAARRIAEAALRDQGEAALLRISGYSEGRVNLAAQAGGVLKVDSTRLDQLNECEGVTFATLRSGSVVSVGLNVATVKIIPYALPEEVLEHSERIASQGASPVIELRPFMLRRVGVVYSGSAAARDRLVRSFEQPLRQRVESFQGQVIAAGYAALSGQEDARLLADLLVEQAGQGVELIIMAGETSTMDRNDIVPRAVACAGGQVACIGAPVEPGNLLVLAYLGGIPVLGVPGCIRSPKTTPVDQVLAALMAGERLSRADITRLGHGGLIEETAHGS